MKTMRSWWTRLGVIGVLILGSCSSGVSEKMLKERSDLGKEVMRIHDEVMPKTEDIHKLNKELDILFQKLNSDTAKSMILESKMIDSVNLKLDEAHELMMQWMRQYNYPADEMIQEEAIKYLNEQKQSIENVRDAINSSLDDAEKLIEDVQQKIETEG